MRPTMPNRVPALKFQFEALFGLRSLSWRCLRRAAVSTQCIVHNATTRANSAAVAQFYNLNEVSNKKKTQKQIKLCNNPNDLIVDPATGQSEAF